jgi:succinate dehydrogenase/fumarate reductase cytochrome b subunit (b558 family)
VRRLFSLSGVIPLGVFLVLHMVTNASALMGDAAFAETTRRTRAIPGVFVLELLLVFAPLALHALYGMHLIATKRALVEPSPYPATLRSLHRAAGVVALAFIAYHLYEYRFHRAMPGLRAEDFYTALSARLSSTTVGAPLRAMVYVVGVAAVTFHFAVGLWGFMVTRQWFISPRARRLAAAGASVLGVGLFVAAANLVTFFATGSRLLGSDVATPLVVEPAACPQPSSLTASP